MTSPPAQSRVFCARFERHAAPPVDSVYVARFLSQRHGGVARVVGLCEGNLELRYTVGRAGWRVAVGVQHRCSVLAPLA